MPSKRKSSACVDYVPALCTHRPSLLPIEWFSEISGLATPCREARRRRELAQTWSFRGSKSRNKVSVGEPAEGSLLVLPHPSWSVGEQTWHARSGSPWVRSSYIWNCLVTERLCVSILFVTLPWSWTVLFRIVVKMKNYWKILSGGSLGSYVDEGRSKMREIVWIAGHIEHRYSERKLQSKARLCSTPVWGSLLNHSNLYWQIRVCECAHSLWWQLVDQ